jgi:hypothetical protein
MNQEGRAVHVGVSIVLAWLIGALLLLGLFWPSIPHSTIGWLALVVFGPLLYFLAELISEAAWSTRLGRAISHHPSFILRILAGVLVGIVVLGVSFWVSMFIVRH